MPRQSSVPAATLNSLYEKVGEVGAIAREAKHAANGGGSIDGGGGGGAATSGVNGNGGSGSGAAIFITYTLLPDTGFLAMFTP